MRRGRPKKRKPSKRSFANLKKRHSSPCIHDTESTNVEGAVSSSKSPASTTPEIPVATTPEIPVTRSGLTYSHFADKSTQTPVKIFCDASTEIEQNSNLLPSCRKNKKDIMKDACLEASERLSRATPPGFHWTVMMLVVVLHFVYSAVWKFNWTWTAAVGMA